MENTIASNTNSQIEPCPSGSHHAVVSKVIGLGLQANNFGTKPKPQIVICWELEPRIQAEGDYQGKRHQLWMFYSLSTGPKAKLTEDMRNIRGRSFTEDEIKHFDVKSMIGQNAFLSVVHEPKDGGVQTKVAAVMKLPKGMAEMKAEGDPNDVPDWVRKIQARAVKEDQMDNSDRMVDAAILK